MQNLAQIPTFTWLRFQNFCDFKFCECQKWKNEEFFTLSPIWNKLVKSAQEFLLAKVSVIKKNY